MDLEAADEEPFFVYVLDEEEEMEDLENIKKREEEESIRLERGVDNRVEKRKAIKKKDIVEDESGG
jgi:hypothetical protein